MFSGLILPSTTILLHVSRSLLWDTLSLWSCMDSFIRRFWLSKIIYTKNLIRYLDWLISIRQCTFLYWSTQILKTEIWSYRPSNLQKFWLIDLNDYPSLLDNCSTTSLEIDPIEDYPMGRVYKRTKVPKRERRRIRARW